MRIARLFLLASCLAAPSLHAQPKRLSPDEDQNLRNAVLAAYQTGGCSATTLIRNSGIRRTLGASHCTLRVDGSPVDLYTFDGITNELFSVDLHANGPAYTTPRLVLIPPLSDIEKPPLVAGSQSLTVRWVVATPERWIVAVGSADASAHGDYVLGFRSRSLGSDLVIPRQCTQQILQCRQSVSAVMSRDSCAYDNLAADPYLVMAPPGQSITAEVDAETPFALRLRYRYTGTGLGGTTSVNNHATLDGYSDRNVELWVENRLRGFYSASLSCSSPVCARPIIVAEPVDQVVKPGKHAELSLELDATLPVNVEWVEGDGTSWSGGPTFTTPALTSDRTFIAMVTNACGVTQSRPVTVHVDNSARQ